MFSVSIKSETPIFFDGKPCKYKMKRKYALRVAHEPKKQMQPWEKKLLDGRWGGGFQITDTTVQVLLFSYF